MKIVLAGLVALTLVFLMVASFASTFGLDEFVADAPGVRNQIGGALLLLTGIGVILYLIDRRRSGK